MPDVLGNEDSAADESFSDGLLEYPQYTRPAEFRGWAVPDVLRSGDHGRGRRLAADPSPVATRRRGGPTCSSAWSGRSALSDDDVRALSEHGYHVPSGSERIDPTEPA